MALVDSPGLTTTPNRRASPRPNLDGGFGLIKGSVQAVQNNTLFRIARPEAAGRIGIPPLCSPIRRLVGAGPQVAGLGNAARAGQAESGWVAIVTNPRSSSSWAAAAGPRSPSSTACTAWLLRSWS